MKTVFKCKAMIPFARASQHRMRLRDFSESHNAAFVSRHDENLSASHIVYREQTHDFVRHFRRAVSTLFEVIEKRPHKLSRDNEYRRNR